MKITNPNWVPLNLYTLISPATAERLGLQVWPYLPPATLHENIRRLISSKGYYKYCDHMVLLDPHSGLEIEDCHPVLVPDLPVDFISGTRHFYFFNRGEKAGRLVTSSKKLKITRGTRVANEDRSAYKNLL